MTKPLISYYGGKQRIASRIAEQIWQIPHTVYAEPFAGGLAVLYAKGMPEITNSDHYREAINDIDDRLINLYRVAREHPEELQRWLELTPYSQSEYRRAIAWLKRDDLTDIQRAWAYYVNINQSFANKLGAGWGTNIKSMNSAATWHQRQTQLAEALQRLSAVYVANEDAVSFIQRFDCSQACFYVDPPYPGTDCGHYGGYTEANWGELIKCLDSIQGSYILSNYAQTVEPQSAQQRIEIEAVMSAAKGKRDRTKVMPRTDNRRTEVLWICDRSAGIREDLKGVVDRLFPGSVRDQPVNRFQPQLSLFA